MARQGTWTDSREPEGQPGQEGRARQRKKKRGGQYWGKSEGWRDCQRGTTER